MGLECLVLWLRMWCLQNFTPHTNQRVQGGESTNCSKVPYVHVAKQGSDFETTTCGPGRNPSKHPLNGPNPKDSYSTQTFQSLPACPLPPPGSHLLGAAGGPWLSYRLRLDFLLGEPSQGCLPGRPQRLMKKSGCLFVKNSRTPQNSWCIWAILNPTPPTQVSFPSTLPANFRV